MPHSAWSVRSRGNQLQLSPNARSFLAFEGAAVQAGQGRDHAASVQDRDSARPLLWNLHRVCTKILLVWADAGYAISKLAAWAAALKMTVQVVAKRDRHVFEVLPAGGWSSAPSPGSASTAAPSATMNASRPATKP